MEIGKKRWNIMPLEKDFLKVLVTAAITIMVYLLS